MSSEEEEEECGVWVEWAAGYALVGLWNKAERRRGLGGRVGERGRRRGLGPILSLSFCSPVFLSVSVCLYEYLAVFGFDLDSLSLSASQNR